MATPKIYTKKGDAGNSSLFVGNCTLPKHSEVFETLGDIDELVALLGIVISHSYTDIPPTCMTKESVNNLVLSLCDIQTTLMQLMAFIATPRDVASERKADVTEFPEDHVARLETKLDYVTSQLPPLRNFVIPGGPPVSSHLHHARAVCRRAERHVWGLFHAEKIDDRPGKYLNRLSDLLFQYARWVVPAQGDVTYNITKKTIVTT